MVLMCDDPIPNKCPICGADIIRNHDEEGRTVGIMCSAIDCDYREGDA